MTLEELPRFYVSEIVAGATTVTLVGRLVGPIWTDKNWVGCLHVGGGRFIWGRFTSVEQDRTAEFILQESNSKSALVPGLEYAYMDAYWGERAELIYDTSRKWTHTEFHPRDARRSGDVIPGGWTHEHCSICWETIAEVAQRFGYSDQNDNWVCAGCYENYIIPKSVDFIRPPNTGFQPDKVRAT